LEYRHDVITVADRLIRTKFGRPVQNHMLMTVKRSKWKTEVEFQYGGRLFSATGSSTISAMDWDIWSKCGMQIVFTSLNARRHITVNRK